MASCDPHLLTIPQELRDLIYEYLRHEVRFYWNTRPHSNFHSENCEVCLPEAPLLSVLLIHPQLKTKYLRKLLHATIRARQNKAHYGNLYDRSRSMWYLPRIRSTWPRIERALALVSQIDIFFDDARPDLDWYLDLEFYDGGFDGCCGLSPILKTVARSAPCLAILCISVRCVPAELKGSRDDEMPRQTNEMFTRDPPPKDCISTPLVQRAEGYRVNYYQAYCLEMNYPYPWLHLVEKIACYVFSRSSDDRCFWLREDMDRVWKLNKYLDQHSSVYYTLSKEDPPVENVGWREKRGNEEAVEGFDDDYETSQYSSTRYQDCDTSEGEYDNDSDPRV